MNYFAMNRFQVAAGRSKDFEEAWRKRRSYLEEVPGFEAFWLLRGPDGEYISCSKWASRKAFEAWTESESFRKAHQQARLPEGVVMGPPRLSCYEAILQQQGGR